MPHGFAHAHGQFRDDLEPLQCLWRQVQFPAAHFQQQKLRVSEDSRQRIVQFVAENLAEVAVVQPQIAQRKAAAVRAVKRYGFHGASQPPLHHGDRRGQAHRRARHEINRARAHRQRRLQAFSGGADPHHRRGPSQKGKRGLNRLPPRAPRPVLFHQHEFLRQDDRGNLFP
jgi:hypothetical protein